MAKDSAARTTSFAGRETETRASRAETPSFINKCAIAVPKLSACSAVGEEISLAAERLNRIWSHFLLLHHRSTGGRKTGPRNFPLSHHQDSSESVPETEIKSELKLINYSVERV